MAKAFRLVFAALLSLTGSYMIELSVSFPAVSVGIALVAAAIPIANIRME